jgi:hypothetical protein
MTLHPAVDPDEVLQSSRQAREFFGGVSEMWLVRRLAEEAAEGDMPFPRPVQIGKRNYWKLGDLRAWRDAQFRAQAQRTRRKRAPPAAEATRGPR